MRCCPPTICFSPCCPSRCWNARSPIPSSRRRKWRTPPALRCGIFAARSARPRTASAPSWTPSSKTPPPTNFCRTPWCLSATAATWCRCGRNTGVKWAASSMTCPPPVPRCSWSPPRWWRPTPASCSCGHRSRRKSPASCPPSRRRWPHWSPNSATAMTPCCKSTCCWPKPVWRWNRTPLCPPSAIPPGSSCARHATRSSTRKRWFRWISLWARSMTPLSSPAPTPAARPLP